MDDADMMLDGNAVAGTLGEIFLRDMTMARILCAGCGSVEPVGAEHAYVHAPGIVLRCRDCEDVVLVMTRARNTFVMGFPGMARLEVDAPTA
ncbi:MAG: DUF6510 family protein [Actinomycetota bacterium]